MISLYGCGFIGSKFKEMYDSQVEIQSRDERIPKNNEILYMISTTDNYNVHDNITLDVETNLKVLCEVLNFCRSKDITFNFISSWFVYGKGVLPAKEDSNCNPNGFYSITKLCAENLIKSFANTYGMNYRILRLCNVLGPSDLNRSRKKNAIGWMIDELKADRNINLYDHGSHTRDVMHVSDVCRAIKLVIDKGNINEIYNIGSGHPTTLSELMTMAKRFSRSRGKILNIEPPDFHKTVQTKNFWMDISKLKSLGFEQHFSTEYIMKDLCLA